jgi:Transglycosylase SLT domain/Peptidase family M23
VLSGLVVAGVFLAGFGGAIIPASAAPHNFLLHLADGTEQTWSGEPGSVPATVSVAGVDVAVSSFDDLGEIVVDRTDTAPDVTPPPDPEPPAETTPTETTPSETTPSETTPSETTPSETTPSETETEGPRSESPSSSSPSSGSTSSGNSGSGSGSGSAGATRRGSTVSRNDGVTRKSSRRKAQAEDEGSAAEQEARADQSERINRHGDDVDTTEQPEERRSDGTPTPANPTYSLAVPGPAPVGVPNFFIEKFRIPPFLLPIYQAAGVEYGVRWEILAAINEIETDYGRNLNVSSAGALGWMQFMPATWEMYGTDANHDGRRDPYNPVDAIFAAARYLKAAGAEEDINRAIFAYNHADWYVDSVLMRARLISGLPNDLVGSLTGLTQGHFPVHAKARYADDVTERQARAAAESGSATVAVESREDRRAINIYAKAGSPVIAVQDGRIVKMGISERLGRYIQLRDAYGNTYTYGHLKKLAHLYPVPKQRTVSKEEVADELNLSAQAKKDPKPTIAASAGRQLAPTAATAVTRGAAAIAPSAAVPALEKERLFANPYRPAAFDNGGEEQLFESGAAIPGFSTFKSFFTEIYGLDREDVVLRELEVGSKVIAGTILGRIGTTDDKLAPHTRFEIRPAGRGAPRVDPKPILDGWKLLESTAIYRAAGRNPLVGQDAKTATIGQILLMSKEDLQRRVLDNANINIYECGRRDIEAGIVDRRVLATLEFLASSGLKPTVSSLQCGHGYLTSSGNVSHHSTGTAVDIAAINGVPILGHQGDGSITDITIRKLLTLQGQMRADQIISLMTFAGADNTLSMADHNDHIHVGWRPIFGADLKLGSQFSAVLKPHQWDKLMQRLGEIDNPEVLTSPSKYALKSETAASDAHEGE